MLRGFAGGGRLPQRQLRERDPRAFIRTGAWSNCAGRVRTTPRFHGSSTYAVRPGTRYRPTQTRRLSARRVSARRSSACLQAKTTEVQ
jgi:hypothetical protein